MATRDHTPARGKSEHGTSGLYLPVHIALVLGFILWLALKQLALMHLIGIPADRHLLLAVLAPTLVLVSPALWLRGRRQIGALLLADAVATLITYANVVYFRQFRDLVSVASLKFASQLGEVHGSVVMLLHPLDLLFWADLLVLAAVLLLRRISLPARLPRQRGIALAGTVLGVVVVTTLILTDPAKADIWSGHTAVAARLGLVNYQTIDVLQYTSRMAKRLRPSPQVVAEVDNWFQKTAATPKPTSSLYGSAKGDNIIYLQVESLHNFVLNLKVNGAEVTPNLNKLLGESVRFKDFYTQVGQGNTSDAEFLANCSMYPAPTGSVYVEYATNNFACLPGLLKAAGYETVSMHSDRPDFWNRATIYPRIGFDKFFSSNDYVQEQRIGMGLADASFLRQSATKLSQLPQPFQAMVITLTSHSPYNNNGIEHQLDLGSLEGTTAGDYLQTIHYVDAAIGSFLADLKAQGLLDHSVLMVYGDHTILRRDTAGLADLLHIAPDDEVTWAKVENRVPLVVRLPSGTTDVRTDPAGEIDLAPTVAGLLGMPTEGTFFMGRDLFAQRDGMVVLHNGSTITRDQMFLAQLNNWGGGCFDRQTSQAVGKEACANAPQTALANLAISTHILDLNLRPNGG